MIITIDGPSGTGKTTIAKKVSKQLSFSHFDTGAMYRSFAYLLKKNGISLTDSSQIKTLLDHFDFSIKGVEPNKLYLVSGEDVTSKIRTTEISSLVSQVAALKEVRDKLVTIQRNFGANQDAVFEGRDIGSVVFPNAELKIFLTATPEVRAKRRYLELVEKDPALKETLTVDEILNQQEERDDRDSKREHSPLIVPDGAIVIDTSDLSIDQVTSKIIAYAKNGTSKAT